MNNELSSVVDALPGLVWTTLPHGRVDFVNRQWRQYTGFSFKESCGDGWQMAIHPKDLPGFLEQFKSSISSGEPFESEVRMRRFDGEFRWFAVRSNLISDASGAPVKWSSLNWDIEDRKKTRERLFQAFYTTKDAGMGIGLSVSRSIIENHGGRFWATPNDGPGVTFSFSIPITVETDGLHPVEVGTNDP